MDLKDTVKVELERASRDALQEMHRSLRVVLDPLEDWVRDVLRRPLGGDWREQLAAHLATWEGEGFHLADESVPVLERWIEAWAHYLDPMRESKEATLAGGRQQGHDFVLSFVPNVSGPSSRHAGVKLSQSVSVTSDGVEVAGPGPETSDSFRQKVQYALELLDPSVARWWKSPSVTGILRARDASSATQFWRRNYHSYLEGGRPVVVVDQSFTAAQAAKAIVAEAEQGYFADSVAVARRRFKASQGDASKVVAEWQKAGLGNAAEFASILAELYVTSIATLTGSGDLIVTLGDLAENGPSWDQLISVLPLIGKLPILAVVVQFAGKQVRLSKAVTRKLKQLNQTAREAIARLVRKAKSNEEAGDIVRREVLRLLGDGNIHHVISGKVHQALERHVNLRGKYRLRDPRFEAIASNKQAHNGYEDWHRDLDKEVVAWINKNTYATEEMFETWLRKRYNEPDLKARFPDGFGG